MMLRILRDKLGVPLAAMLTGATTGETLDAWINGKESFDPRVDQRLRGAYAMLEGLLEVDSPEVVQAWFLGMNPLLDDRAPVSVWPEDPAAVLNAALFFVANG
jgi:hypothetical protein